LQVSNLLPQGKNEQLLLLEEGDKFFAGEMIPF
jgi:hypothetical protein